MAYEMTDFQKDVIEVSRVKPVVIDFWAQWCGPCRVLGPVIEKLAGEAKGKWALVKIDTDRHPDIAMQFQIRGIPAVKMVYNGQLIAEFTGAQPEATIRQWLEKNLPEGIGGEEEESWQERVALALSQGDREAALHALEAGNAEGDEAILKKMMLVLPKATKDARELMAAVSTIEKYQMEEEILETVERLSAIRDGETDPEQGDSSDPSLQETYKKGIEMLFAHDFEQALNHFLTVMQKSRSFDDDGARKACLAIFAMLGEPHPITHRYRRVFSMSLY